MFRPGMNAFQSWNGPPVMPMQQQQQQHHVPMTVPPPIARPAFRAGYQQNFVQQQNIAYASHPPMPHQQSHEFSTIALNQGTPSSTKNFAGPPPPPPPSQGPLFYGQPPRYPNPPFTNFSGALPPRPTVDMPPPTFPPRPTFSPLVSPQPSQLSQTFPPSHMVPQQMPQPPFPAGEFCQPIPPENVPQPPPPPPAFTVWQPSPFPQTQPFNPQSSPPIPTSDLSQPLPNSTDMSDPRSSSQSKPLPPPPHKPSDDEMIQNIEILSEFVVKNGPEFENMARARQAGNPKFSFLFNGTPGSEAAIGYQYFQWMKMKWELQMKVDHEAETGGKPSEQLEQPQQANDSTFESQAVPSSPAASDVDMEDDFAITAMPNKAGKDQYSTHVAGISSISEQEHTNASSNLTLDAADSGKKEELLLINAANMELSESESSRKIGFMNDMAYKATIDSRISIVLVMEDISPLFQYIT